MVSWFSAFTETANSILAGTKCNADGEELTQRIKQSDVIKEGWLLKESRNVREWRPRWIVLASDCFATFQRGPSEEYEVRNATEVLFFSAMVTCRSADAETGIQNTFCMQRQKDGKFFYLQATDHFEKEAWVGAIGRQMVKRTVMLDEGGNASADGALEDADYTEYKREMAERESREEGRAGKPGHPGGIGWGGSSSGEVSVGGEAGIGSSSGSGIGSSSASGIGSSQFGLTSANATHASTQSSFYNPPVTPSNERATHDQPDLLPAKSPAGQRNGVRVTPNLFDDPRCNPDGRSDVQRTGNLFDYSDTEL